MDKLIEKNIAGSDGVFFEKLRSRLKSMVVVPVDAKIKTLQKQLVELINKREKAVADDEDKKVSDYTKQIDKLNDDIALLEMGQSDTNQSDIEVKKAELKKQIEALPDDMIYGAHVTQDQVAQDIFNSQFKYGLGTGLQGTIGLTSKQGLLTLMNNLLDGNSPHRNQFGVFIVAWPKSEFGETTINNKVDLDKIESDMLDNYPEMSEGKIPTKFNFGYFKNGKLFTNNDKTVTEEPVAPGQNKKNHDDIVEILESRLVVKGVINQIEGSTGVSMSLDYWDKNKKVIFYNHDRTITPEDYGSQVELKLIENYKVGDKIFKNVIEVRQGDRVLGLVAETDYVTPKEEKELVEDVLELISENTYADSRTAGNYIDKAVKDLFSKGIQPKFVEGAITREAYESLFGPDGYLTELKNQADNGDIFIASDNLVVWDSDIILPGGVKDRIAGEIDLLIVDKDGTTRIVDIKTGEERTWNIFNSTQTKPDKKVFAKRESFTLQQAAYSRLYENMFGVTPTIHIFPIERESNKDTEQVLTAGKPGNPTLFNNIQYEIDPETGNFVLDAFGNPKFTILDKGVNPNKFIPLYIETVQDRINSVLPLKAVATATEDVVETPETNEEEEKPTKKKKSNFVNDNQNDPYTVGTMVFDADGNSYQIITRFKNGNVTIIGSDKTKIKMTMKELEENYKLESEVYNPTAPAGEYNLTPEEEDNLQASEDNVDVLLDDPAATDALINDADNISSSKAEDDLLDDLNCK
jgi:hypothetical protein